MKVDSIFLSELDKDVDEKRCTELEPWVFSPDNLKSAIVGVEAANVLNAKVGQIKDLDKVRTVGFIGEGRFGVVARGTLKGSTEKVAVKLYHSIFYSKFPIGNHKDKLVFLKHPAIVKTSTVIRFGDICYSIMELGLKNLYDDVIENGKYEENNARAVMRQLIGGLEFLHKQKIVHGNIHTKNIILFEGGIVKLADVSNEKVIERLPYSQVPLFSLPYVAPELKTNGLNDADRKSDMWSLGVCFFFMIVGQTPFNGSTRETIERAVDLEAFHIPFSADKMCRHILQNLITLNVQKRMSLRELKKHEWFAKTAVHPKRKIGDETTSKPKNQDYDDCLENPPGDICDFGYDQLIEDDEKLLRQFGKHSGFLGGDSKGFAVYVIENNREEWDPTTVKLDLCFLVSGKSSRPCLRIALPLRSDDSDLLAGVQESVPKAVPSSGSKETVIDSDYGDYTLMEFTIEGGRLCNEPRYGTRFQSSKHAAYFYNKLNADRLWDSLKLERCENCVIANEDSKEHIGKNCIYQHLSQAHLCNELIHCTVEDVHNVRMYRLPIQTYTPPVRGLSLFRNRSVRFVSSGVRKLVKKLRF